MAYQIPIFTDPRSGAPFPDAYARIKNVIVNKAQKWARVQFDIFASKELREAEKTPVSYMQIVFAAVPGAPDNYTPNFASAPVATADLPAAAVNVDDVVTSQAYIALKTHPDTAAILAAATVV
jgi:hypothetical protein